MGAFAHQAKGLNLETKLITSDLDMLQLIKDGNTEILTIKKGFSDITKFNQKAFEDKYGLEVEQFIDYKALMGDSSDNIPGVAGIGPKAAKELLNEYQTLDLIYENLWKPPPLDIFAVFFGIKTHGGFHRQHVPHKSFILHKFTHKG